MFCFESNDVRFDIFDVGLTSYVLPCFGAISPVEARNPRVLFYNLEIQVLQLLYIAVYCCVVSCVLIVGYDKYAT